MGLPALGSVHAKGGPNGVLTCFLLLDPKPKGFLGSHAMLWGPWICLGVRVTTFMPTVAGLHHHWEKLRNLLAEFGYRVGG